MLIVVILTSATISFTCYLLIKRAYQIEIDILELENRLQAEHIEQLEQERARLHWQLLAHLSEPGQQVNVYRN